MSDESIYPNFISFDSEDRDITKYPSANEWGIQLPKNYSNIKSISLYDSAIPFKNIYTIHQNYQNNAFIITKSASSSDKSITFNTFDTNTYLTSNSKCLNLSRPLQPYIHTSRNSNGSIIETDFCNVDDKDTTVLAKSYQDWALKQVRNNIDTEDLSITPNPTAYFFTDFHPPHFIHKTDSSIHMVLIPNGNYTISSLKDQLVIALQNCGLNNYISVFVNELTSTIYFKQKGSDSYSFDFDTKIIYPKCNYNMNSVHDYNSYWGLGYHLGFNKKKYIFSNYDPLIGNTFISAHLGTSQYIIPENSVRLTTPTVIYMEIDKYNSICEYKNINNKISGEVNSFFAKIFIGSDEHFNGNNINSTEYTTISKQKLFDRLSKFNFKFRFHNGILVEFMDNFNFTLKLNEVL